MSICGWAEATVTAKCTWTSMGNTFPHNLLGCPRLLPVRAEERGVACAQPYKSPPAGTVQCVQGPGGLLWPAGWGPACR